MTLESLSSVLTIVSLARSKMRNTWRLLLLRGYSRSSICSSRIRILDFQAGKLDPTDCRCFSSFLDRNGRLNRLSFALDSELRKPRTRHLSSEPALEQKDLDHVVLSEIFSNLTSSDEIKDALEANNIPISYELVLTVLYNLGGSPEIAGRFFNWVSETHSAKLSSKSYNLMLRALGRKGHTNEFWDLVEVMNKKGYGISKATYVKVLDNLEKDGMVSDLDKLKQLFALKSEENSLATMCSSICKIIEEDEWGMDCEKRLGDLNVSLSSDLVVMVLENLSLYPMKATMFFQWVEEKLSFKHDKQTYNAMVKILGREDCILKFWFVVDETKGAGYKMGTETYVKVFTRFVKRKMIKEAVNLYEFAMSNADKPPVQDSVFLLRKIVAGKDLDMDLFCRVLRVFTEGGNVLTKSIFNTVLRSLTSVGRSGECPRILKAMKEVGFVVTDAVQSEIVSQLCSAGRLDEAIEFLDEMEASGCSPCFRAWACLIQGQCVAGYVDKASSCFQKVLESKGVTEAGYAFEMLINGFCQKKRAEDACKLLSDLVNGKHLRPWHTTYKILIRRLAVEGKLEEALSLLKLMKSHGFPPYIDPFIEYISKSGTSDDAMNFLKALTVEKFPSTAVFLRMFKAFLKSGRHSEAHDCLSISPHYIRRNADVLNLFCSMKPTKAAADVSA